VKKISVIVIMTLAMVPSFDRGAMAQSFNDTQPEGDQSLMTASSLKRNYPGGRDDTDLTVQPKKMITRKEVTNRADEVDEEDFDQGDAANGFGE
jgi:hypothetical protein